MTLSLTGILIGAIIGMAIGLLIHWKGHNPL